MRNNNANSRTKQKERYSPSLKFVAILLFVAISSWLACTAYVTGQLEIKRSRLILTSEGCRHLKQYSIIPQLLPDSESCSAELLFRPDLFSRGGLARTDLGTIRLSECHLVSYLPLEEPDWWAERWHLVLWETICSVLLLFMMWLFEKTADRRND